MPLYCLVSFRSLGLGLGVQGAACRPLSACIIHPWSFRLGMLMAGADDSACVIAALYAGKHSLRASMRAALPC